MLVAWLSVGLAAVVILLAVMRGGEDDSAPPARTTVVESVGASSADQAPPSEPAASSHETDVEADRPILPLLANDPPAAEGVIAPERAAPETPPEERAPIDVPIAPDLPKVDVAKQLAQPILLFAQEKPVEVRRLLQQVAEMSAVPVDSSAVEVAPWRERLERPVTLVLKKTTVGEILSAVMELCGLRTETIDGVIHILPPAEST
jgi:hypothetical protein